MYMWQLETSICALRNIFVHWICGWGQNRNLDFEASNGPAHLETSFSGHRFASFVVLLSSCRRVACFVVLLLSTPTYICSSTLTCGWFCECGLIHHKPFWKHQAKPATFLPDNGTTQVYGVRPQHRELRALLFSNSARVLLRPTGLWTMKSCQTGPTVYRPCTRRLESLTMCRRNYKNEIQICHLPLSTDDDRWSIETCFANWKLLLIFYKRQHFLLTYLKTLSVSLAFLDVVVLFIGCGARFEASQLKLVLGKIKQGSF